MALFYEIDVPGGVMSLTIEGNAINATFDYPAAFGDRSHTVTGPDATMEAFCQSDTITIEYDDADLTADAVLVIADTTTGKAYRWNLEHPDESGWITTPPDPRTGLPWWLQTARNMLRP